MKTTPPIDSKLLSWLDQHKRTLLMAAVVVFLLFLGFFRFALHKEKRHTHDFLAAEVAFSQLQSNPSEVTTLEKLLLRHRELEAKYDGPIAQHLLFQGQAEEAKRYLDRQLSRTGSLCEYTAAFSKTTLLIEMGEFIEAKLQAHTLQSKIEEHPFDCPIRLHNLFRVALLEEELGDADTKHKAWQDLILALEKAPEHLPGLSTDSVSLLDYAKAQIVKAIKSDSA